MKEKKHTIRLTVNAQVTIMPAIRGEWYCVLMITKRWGEDRVLRFSGIGKSPSGALAEALADAEEHGLNPEIAPADLRALFAEWEGEA